MNKQAYDYGQVLMWAAVIVSMPRWAGAFIAADVSIIPPLVDQILHYLNLVSGFGMALLEVLGAAYLLDAWGRMKPKRTHNSKNYDHRWIVLTGFVIGLFLLMPLILAPYVVSRMTTVNIADIGNGIFIFLWSVAVVMSPVFIVGGVAVARDGLVGVRKETFVQPPQPKSKVAVQPRENQKSKLRTREKRLNGTKALVYKAYQENPDATQQEVADWLSDNHSINITRQAVGKHARSLNGGVK